jgi:4'-phosphopantetheinyl transferase
MKCFRGEIMIEVYVRSIIDLMDKEAFDHTMSEIDTKRVEKIMKCFNPAEKRRSLGAALLIMQGLENYLAEKKISFDLKQLEYEYEENGKPRFKQFPEIYFNISHSGDYVVCAFSKEPVGIDIQQMNENATKIASRYYSKAEQEQLEMSSRKVNYTPKQQEKEKMELFFWLWTAKESYIKYTGKGMHLPLDTFTADREKELIFRQDSRKAEASLYEIKIPDNYKCMVCAEKLNPKDCKVYYQNIPV